MNEKILFALPRNEKLTREISSLLNIQIGESEVRCFPDGESYVRILSSVKNMEVILVCTLDHPDSKLLPLLFVSQTLKQLGAKKVLLVAPYLAYMRQDKRFKPGEAITSEVFAGLISKYFDSMITVDPHLHRRSNLSEIYSIPTQVIHAAESVSAWIKEKVHKPLLIGPDEESEQWVAAVSKDAGAPYLILEKRRKGDREVEISKPNVEEYRDYTPVLVDDIISTGKTMIKTIEQLRNLGMQRAVCIGVHAVFANQAYEELLGSGIEKIVTCNTIFHPSNGISISKLLAQCLQ